MAAWLNLFLLIGLSRISEIVIAAIALLAGMINLKDFWFYGRAFHCLFRMPQSRIFMLEMRRILHAENLTGALIGTVVLAIFGTDCRIYVYLRLSGTLYKDTDAETAGQYELLQLFATL